MANGKKTLVQRIALEGGEDIRKELLALGEVGEKAFAALKKAADETAAAGSGFNRFLAETRRQLDLTRQGAALTAAGLRDVGSAFATVGVRVAAVSAIVAGAGTALFLFTKNAADAADALYDSSQAAGLAADEYGRLKFAFEQNGSSAAGLDTAMRKLNVNIKQASEGTGAGAALFKQLGVSVTDASGRVRSAEAIFQDVSDAFVRLPDGATKSALAIQLFGRSGGEVVQVLNQGGDAIRAFGVEAERLGLVLSNDMVAAGTRFNDSFDRLKATINAVRVQLGLLIAPAFTEGFDALVELIVQNREALLELAEDIAANVIPIVRDFFAILRGDDESVELQWLLDLRDTLVAVGDAFRLLSSVVQTFFAIIANTIQPFVDLFNMIFGTNVSAEEAILLVVLGQLLGVFRAIGLVVTGVTKIFAGLQLIFGQTVAQIGAVIAGALLMQGTLKTVVDAIYAGLWTLIEPIAVFVGWIIDAVKALLVFFGFITENVPGAVEDVDAVKESIGKTGEALDDIAKNTGPAAAAGVGAIGGAKPGVDKVTEALKSMGTTGEQAWQKIGDGITKVTQNMEGLLVQMQHNEQQADALYSALAKVGGSSGSFQTLSGGGGNSIQELASGGPVSGPGTGTSDSILSWLSNGEFVMKAKAVRRFGLGFMQAINSGRMPRGFSTGGLVNGLTRNLLGEMPRFASGGLVEVGGPDGLGGRPLNLTIGNEVFEGLLAPEKVAEKLVAYANGRSTRSAGRKPAWKR